MAGHLTRACSGRGPLRFCLPSALPPAGSIIAIPSGETSIPACVLFVSAYWKDVILLGAPYEPHVDTLSLRSLAARLRILMYSSQASIHAGRWPVVGAVQILDPEPFTTRIVADSVWVADRILRPTAPDDYDCLPVMRVAGEGAVESLFHQVFGAAPQSPFARHILRESTRRLQELSRRTTEPP